MTLSEQITRINESTGPGPAPHAVRQSLEQLIVGTTPGDLTAAGQEIRRLKFEAALAKVDSELEAERQACMIHYKRSMHEPDRSELWVVPLIAGSFVIFFARMGLGLRKDMGPFGLILGFGPVAILTVTTIRHTREVYGKLKRLETARTRWEEVRKRLVEAQTSAGV